MSIIQISKIQQRSGNIVDLPQLDEAEFGWASDTKQLFIGKTTPNENIEVLTSYSQINFDQINGTVGNLNISNVTVANGQVLAYDGNNWVNRGGAAGGLINLGEVSNVKISGGAIGYVLETDGLGNLAWTPKSSIISFIQNVTKASPAVVTTTQENFLTDGLRITITNAQGMTQLNGNTYFVDVLTSNTFALYSDAGLSTPINSTGFNNYSFTTATATTAVTNIITVGNSAVFALNQAVEFLGDLGNSTLENNIPYYIKTIPNGTTITVSDELLANGVAGNTKALATETLVGANVYATGGRAIATVSGGGSSTAAQGSEGSVQYYASGLLQGDADFVWNANATPKTLTATGNINTGNVNSTGVVTSTRLISNIATGTAPLAVTSTTRVANLNVDRANISDFGAVTAQTTGTFFPVFVNSSATGNRALGANANISFNAATSQLSVTGQVAATSLSGSLVTASQPNITSVGTLTSLGVGGNITAANITANTGIFTGNGSGISAINASNLSSGTVPTARLSGSYSISVTSANTAATVTTNAQPNITSVGTLTSLAVTGNVTAGNLYANSGRLGVSIANTATLNVTGVSNLNAVGNVRIFGGNANQILQTDGSGNLSWTDPNGGYYLHTQVSASTTWTVTHNLNRQYVTVEPIDSNGNSYTGRYDYPVINYTNANALTMTFTSAVAGYAAVTGGGTNINSVSVGNSTPGGVNTQVQFNDAGALAGSSGLVYNKTTGTLTATLYAGSGANLTNIAGANVTGAVAFATTANSVAGANVSGTVSSATTATTAGTVTTAAQPNITSVGTLTSLSVTGNISAGNVSATNIFGSGANLASLNAGNLTTGTVPSARLSGTYTITVSGSATTAGTVTTAAQPNITSVGTLSSLGVTGNVTAGNVYANSGTIGAASVLTPALTTGANTTAGTITGNWTLTTGSRLQATYADLAEYYEADDIYIPGTVLMFGGDKEVTLAEDGTNRVAGVVSTNPAYVMNSTCPGLLTAIALQGRVPCKVRGKIKKGDMLISGGNGYARPNQFPTIGTVIGKALEDFDGYEGVIEVAVGRL